MINKQNLSFMKIAFYPVSLLLFCLSQSYC